MVSLQAALPGNSPAARQLRHDVESAAGSDFPVLLSGASGTGKNVVARLIHDLGDRKERPFVAVNLASIAPGLAWTQLLGHVQGAFTGADRDRPGAVEAANHGTLYLDEIDQAPPEFQALLLEFLESGKIRRVGEVAERSVDVRVISATSRDLQVTQDVRVDLLNRFPITITLPPLRKRKADIPQLTSQLTSDLSIQLGTPVVLAEDAMLALQRHSFPGNIRELRHILQSAALSTRGQTIHASDLSISSDVARAGHRARRSDLDIARRELQALRKELESVRATSIPARPIWQGRGFAIQHDYCFVLMPFADTKDVQTVYREHVKPIIEQSGLKCERADDIYDISGVMQSVWEGISRARIVVADLTERNPNVFYELGIAHTLGKPVIMLTQSIDYVPFDLRHLRCIVYQFTPRGAVQLEHSLERTIKSALSASVSHFG